MHQEYADYIYEPMRAYHKEIYKRVIAAVQGNDICDLGSHAVGHYWALGYIERVQSYSCYDLSGEALSIFTDTINALSPAILQDRYAETLDFLYENSIISADVTALAHQLKSKLKRIRQFDFLKDKPDQVYDTVLALESLLVVDTEEDFFAATKVAYDFLKDGGTLLMLLSQYDSETAPVQEMQNHRIEGRLNPGAELANRALSDRGFREITMETMPIDYDGYLNSIVVSARR